VHVTIANLDTTLGTHRQDDDDLSKRRRVPIVMTMGTHDRDDGKRWS